MATTECGYGHIYDSDRYATCPYCNSTQTVIHFGDIPVGNGGKTTPIGYEAMPHKNTRDGRPTAEGGRTQPLSGYGGRGAEQPVTGRRPTMPPPGYDATGRRVDSENKTKGMLGKKLGLDPVVGWLVCIDGSEKGKDYRLMGKINTIGRSREMDICIEKDETISREVHARLAYDPRHNQFRLLPGNSGNNIYLNDEPVYEPVLLDAYDAILLGETTLLFVPFCMERFNWKDGLSPAGKMGGI